MVRERGFRSRPAEFAWQLLPIGNLVPRTGRHSGGSLFAIDHPQTLLPATPFFRNAQKRAPSFRFTIG